MAGAEASRGGGTQQQQQQQQLADADASTTRELCALCLAAAVGIRDECFANLLLLDSAAAAAAASSAGSGGVGAKAEGRACSNSTTTNDDAHPESHSKLISLTSPALAGCGTPLMQLLARQAACLIARYSPPPSGPSEAGRPPKEAPRSDAVHSASLDGDRRRRSRGGGLDRVSEAAGGGPATGGRGDSRGDLVLKRLDDLLSIAYSRFYAYLYKDLPLCWRQLYTDAAILKFSYLFLLLLPSVNEFGYVQRTHDGGDASFDHAASLPHHSGSSPILDNMVKTLDLALILAGAGGETRGRAWINKAFALLERVRMPDDDTRQAAAVDDFHTPDVHDIPAGRPQPPAPKRIKLNDARSRHSGPSVWDGSPSFSAYEPFTPPVSHSIRRVSAREMDMPAFQRYLDAAPRDFGPQPLVLTGLVENWPARAERPWAKPAYLLARTFGGRRLVPVEVGRSYVDAGWGQKIVRFADFVAEYVDPSLEHTPPPSTAGRGEDAPAKPTAYLAQHQLFLQLPQLRDDILLPDLCYTAPPPHPTDPAQDQPELDEPMLNAWFGPPGTITPLHTDPYHNLLVQVVGRKYVRLYEPQQTRSMRARGKEDGVEMGNTSLLDVGVVEGWDGAHEEDESEGVEEEREEDRLDAEASEQDREGFRAVPFLDCILEPGDTLHIPIGWWHYVRGLSVSFSVSIWWN
ncbi:unnamed protein product [Discula destructiva]